MRDPGNEKSVQRPKVEVLLACLRNSKEPKVAAAE